MTEYVDREKVEARLRAYADNVPKRFSEVIKGLIDAVVLDLTDAIKDTPTADVRENVKGHWDISEVKKGEWWHTCSKCKATWGSDDCELDLNFCPNCGAAMEGTSDG